MFGAYQHSIVFSAACIAQSIERRTKAPNLLLASSKAASMQRRFLDTRRQSGSIAEKSPPPGTAYHAAPIEWISPAGYTCPVERLPPVTDNQYCLMSQAQAL